MTLITSTARRGLLDRLIRRIARLQVYHGARPESRAPTKVLEVGDANAQTFEASTRHIEDTKARRVGETLRDLEIARAEEPEASTYRALLEDEVDVGVVP